MSESRIIWRGFTVKGMDACVIASHGGNKKTKALLELTLVPTIILSQWEALSAGVKPSQQGSTYVKAMRDLIEGVCPSECGFIASGKCYVQHNSRNAGQVARIIRGVVTIPALGFCDPAFIRTVAKHAKFAGLSRVRSMVAGDACMVPKAEWTVIQTALCTVFPPVAWLGYTHGWSTADHLRLTHVASCESTDAALRARSIGWSVFEVGAANMQTLPAGARLCPASAEFKNLRGFDIGCNACPMACNGTGRNGHTVIARHAPGDSSTKAAAGRRGFVIRDNSGRVRGMYPAPKAVAA